MLIALRTWAPRWCGRRFSLRVRSDSVSALSMLLKCRSAGEGTNLIACELALDLAKSMYRPDICQHIPGVANKLPDALSRVHQPTGGGDWPPALKHVPRARPPARDQQWYRSLLIARACH